MAEGAQIDTLREVPASEILAKIEKGEPVEYDYVRIIGDLDISKLNLTKRNIDRTDLEINSLGLNKDIAIITSRIQIMRSVIQGLSDLGEVAFEEPIDFSESKFDGYATFCGSRFTGASFVESQFNDDANFSGCQFKHADFRGARFNKWAEFLGSGIEGHAEFEGSVFNERVDFLRSQFRRFATDFSKCKFNSAVYLNGSEFSGDVNFEKSEFNGDISFNESKFKGDILTFKYSKFRYPKSQEEACRRAKNVLEKNGDREEAGYHFYREMEAKRKQKTWYYRYPEYVFIQRIFGYGVHPWWLWAWWFFFVGIFAAIYWKWNGVIGATRPLDYIWFSITVAVTPGFAGYKPVPGLFQVLAGLEAIFGTFMWAAFIATFARKYMR
jgi:uncharacterized protein YjbI with pentapeptide repeats